MGAITRLAESQSGVIESSSADTRLEDAASRLKTILQLTWQHPVTRLVVATVFIVASAILSNVVGAALRDSLGKTDSVRLLVSLVMTCLAVGAYWLFVRFVERRPFTDFELAGAGREWGFGAVAGFLAMTAAVGTMALFGGYEVTGTNGMHVLLPVAAMALSSGVTEEILLRGIAFRFAEQWLGSWFALAFSAVLFGAIHLGNPNATPLAGAAIALEAGIMLAAVYMLTRRLWAAIGIHMAWNFTQAGVYGVAVSGFQMNGLLANRIQGSEWLTGGEFGAEAGLPAMLVCTALGLWFLKRAHNKGRFISPSWNRFRTGRT